MSELLEGFPFAKVDSKDELTTRSAVSLRLFARYDRARKKARPWVKRLPWPTQGERG
jgi:hypothetical protein